MAAGTDDHSELILHRLGEQDKKLDSIERHVCQTNARVRKLELWRARIDGALASVRWLPAFGLTITAATTSGVLVWLVTG